jgi:L-ascorbate metabolism protein UlaG (beta-lactamase superfamily)
MRLTLISHACWLIETTDLTILTDPVFGDVFYDSMGTWCPSRRFNPEALPEIDAIFISHPHHDHFDPPTLAGLARRVPMVLCSSDADVVDACRRVGFETVHPIKDFQAFKVGQTTLHITPAINNLESEHGLLVTDPDARVWNAVDSGFKPEWLPVLRIDGRGLDVHLANFNPVLLHEAMANGATHYPYAPYSRHLDTARLARAKLIVPGASGVSWLHRAAWLNHYLFPIKHERFIEDVRGFENDSRAEICFPGDVIEIIQGEPRVHRQARPELVSTLDPRTFDRLDFNPTHPLPPLAEVDAATQIIVGVEGVSSLSPRLVTVPAAGFASLGELEQAVEDIFATVNRRLADPGQESFKDTLDRWGARMRVMIHFPDGPRYWSCDFSAPKPEFTQVEIAGANYFLEVTAIDLHALERGLIFDQFIHTGLRCFHTLYRVRKEGIVYPAMASQFRREVEQELHHGEVMNPFDAFMQLWRPTRVPWVERLVKLSLESLEREAGSTAG